MKYCEALARRVINLEVAANEVISIIGPNGSGKSTLFRAISGLIVWEGDIYIDDIKIEKKNPIDVVKMGVIHCPENHHLFTGLNVKDNLMLGAYLRQNKDAINRDLEDVYQLFPILDKREKQQAENLSGGERQMLTLGRALMSAPRLLMIDEPTLGLSPLVCEHISKGIERIRKKDIAVFIAEQNVTFAIKNAEKICLLETGKIVKEGPKDVFLEDRYVRETYLGI